MLLIIYIPVTRVKERQRDRERERERKGAGMRATRGRKGEKDGEREVDLWYPRNGTTSHAPETLSLSLSFSLSSTPGVLARPTTSLPQTVPSAQKTRRFIAKERRENVDLSSYVQPWQFVCPRTLSVQRGCESSERDGTRRGNR